MCGPSDIIYIRHSHWLDYNFSHVNTNTMAAADAHSARTSVGAMRSAVANNIRNDVPLSLIMRDDTVQLYAACRAFGAPECSRSSQQLRTPLARPRSRVGIDMLRFEVGKSQYQALQKVAHRARRAPKSRTCSQMDLLPARSRRPRPLTWTLNYTPTMSSCSAARLWIASGSHIGGSVTIATTAGHGSFASDRVESQPSNVWIFPPSTTPPHFKRGAHLKITFPGGK